MPPVVGELLVFGLVLVAPWLQPARMTAANSAQPALDVARSLCALRGPTHTLRIVRQIEPSVSGRVTTDQASGTGRRKHMASELEPERRFELLTCALRVRCSTD